MQRVKDLYEQLGGPGQQRLWLEVRKRNIAVSRQQVFDFVARQGERQVFTRPLPKAEGKTARDKSAEEVLKGGKKTNRALGREAQGSEHG